MTTKQSAQTRTTKPGLGNGAKAQGATVYPKPSSPALPDLPGRLLRLDEVAARLSVAVVTVRRLIKTGDLKAVKVGKAIRVRPADLEEYLRRSVVEVSKTAQK